MNTDTDHGWGRSKRLVASLLILLHMAAVCTGPFAFATRAEPGIESPVATALMGLFGPYGDLAFLNHGYFFFAPNPGPSALVRYKVEFDDGRPSVEGVFPDRNVHKPRLLYHRHFMLSEQWNAQYVSSEPPPLVASDPDRRREWQRQRGLYELQKRSFEQHLSSLHGGGRVTLTRVEHRPAEGFEIFREGRSLTDPVMYRDLPEDFIPLEEAPPRMVP